MRAAFIAGLLAVCPLALADGLRWDPLGEPGCGGWMTAVQVSPHNPRHIMLSGDVMGAAVSFDGGDSWVQSAGLTNQEIADSTFHPSNPNELWLGTLGGPFKSTDGGKSWIAKRGGMPPVSPAAYSVPIQKISYDPNNPQVLLAFGGSYRWGDKGGLNQRNGAIWKSSDGGENWKLLTTIGDAQKRRPDDGRGLNLQTGGYAAASSDVLFTCTEEGGVFRSTDGGVSFTAINSGLPSRDARYLALHSTNPKVLWVAMAGGWVFKSTDGGDSWQESSEGLGVPSPATRPERSTSEPAVIAVSRSNPDVLYVDHRRGGRNRYRSTDGGAHWTQIVRNSDTSSIVGGVAYPNGNWASFLSVDPNNPDRVLTVNSELLLESTNGGKTWRDVLSYATNGGWRGTGYSGMCASNIRFSPYRPLHVFTLAWDAGKLLRSEDGLWSWKLGQKGFDNWNGGHDATFAADGTIYVAFGQNREESIGKSTDWGKNWAYLPRPKGVHSVNHAVHTMPQNSSIVWALVGAKKNNNAGIFKSTDGGQTWTDILPVGTDVLYNIATSASGLPFYVAGQKAIYKTTDGNTFTTISGAPSTGHRNFVYLDPSNTERIYVTNFHFRLGDGVWRYDGKWEKVFNMPSAVALAVDHRDPKVLAVVTKDFPSHDICSGDGVWISSNGGANWQSYNTGMRMLRSDAVAFNPDRSGQLIVGTGGAGFYVTDLGFSTPFNGQPAAIPGIIEAEQFDKGANAFRRRGEGATVEVQTLRNGAALTNLQSGDWTKYRVNVAADGLYDFIVRVSGTGGRLHLTANGVNVTGPIASSQGEPGWRQLRVRRIRLRAGEQYLKLYSEAPGFQVDRLQFTASAN